MYGFIASREEYGKKFSSIFRYLSRVELIVVLCYAISDKMKKTNKKINKRRRKNNKNQLDKTDSIIL